jgi:hypothetical protein
MSLSRLEVVKEVNNCMGDKSVPPCTNALPPIYEAYKKH